MWFYQSSAYPAPHLSLEARHGNLTATHRPTGSSQPCCCCGSRSRRCTAVLRRVSSLNCKFHSQPWSRCMKKLCSSHSVTPSTASVIQPTRIKRSLMRSDEYTSRHFNSQHSSRGMIDSRVWWEWEVLSGQAATRDSCFCSYRIKETRGTATRV